MTKDNVQRANAQIKLVYDQNAGEEFPLRRLMEEIGLEMKSFATSAGLIIMQKLMEAEVEYLAGPRKSRTTEVNRWCKERGSVVVGGQRRRTERQRLRTRDNTKEVPLRSYTMFHQDDERTRAVYQRMLAGVSCRNYRSTLEEMADAIGVSRSVISRKIIESTETDLKELCERDLSGLDIRVLVIDGKPLDGLMVIGAVGVETAGKKHFLGFREGATENSDVCKDLLEDIAKRGLKMDRPMLVLIDGSKALSKAVKDFCGVNAVIQRCQFHKTENLKKYLTHRYQAEYERKLKAIYALREYEDAQRALKSLIGEMIC